MTIRDLEVAILQRERYRSDIRSVRIYFPHEIDVLVINRSGFCTEFELKMSRSDFKADFKKKKHLAMKKGKGGTIKRFYFVAPKGLIKLEEIPSYAGFIEVEIRGNDRYATEIKEAPSLKSKKASDVDRLRVYRSMMYRFLNNQYKDLKNAIV